MKKYIKNIYTLVYYYQSINQSSDMIHFYSRWPASLILANFVSVPICCAEIILGFIIGSDDINIAENDHLYIYLFNMFVYFGTAIYFSLFLRRSKDMMSSIPDCPYSRFKIWLIYWSIGLSSASLLIASQVGTMYLLSCLGFI